MAVLPTVCVVPPTAQRLGIFVCNPSRWNRFGQARMFLIGESKPVGASWSQEARRVVFQVFHVYRLQSELPLMALGCRPSWH